MSQGLEQLSEVELINLPQLKGRDRNDIVLASPSLQVLRVRDCPQLTPFIVPTNIQALDFREMTEKKQISNVTVPERRGGTSTFIDCRRLRYIFSPTIARNLPLLWMLNISDCEELEQIIEKDQTSSQHHLQPICFPNLKWITIVNCKNLKCLFPITLAHGGLPNLDELYLKKVSKLEQVFEGDEGNVSKDEKKVIHLPHLRSLEIDELPNLVSFSPVGYHFVFPFLTDLQVEGCPNITTRFSVDSEKAVHAKTQPERRGGTSTCTEYLTISNFEELFEYSGYNLSSLKFLTLSELTELRVIWSGPIQVKHFQNLTQLTVDNCRRLRYIFSPTIAQNLPQLWTLDIFDCEELEQIIEKDQTSSQHHLQPICFPNLSWIKINNCENLKCLFPITLAHGGLPNLDRLDLIRLSKLEQVFEGDESNVSKDEEKVIRLPQLLFLELYKLPNLVSFSPVGYHFVFPFLTGLQVKGCPNITTRFSVDSEKSMHAKTQASQSVDEITVEEAATAQETAWPIGSDIEWWGKVEF
ncbi:hypothetical protein GOBAR_DD27097 [Gossypium barbadense]|nr:hypothetical protein GOBAR_DD27097 [Gossypium barbadense]